MHEASKYHQQLEHSLMLRACGSVMRAVHNVAIIGARVVRYTIHCDCASLLQFSRRWSRLAEVPLGQRRLSRPTVWSILQRSAAGEVWCAPIRCRAVRRDIMVHDARADACWRGRAMSFDRRCRHALICHDNVHCVIRLCCFMICWTDSPTRSLASWITW